MPRYAMLIAPSANRVYSAAAPGLAAAELAVLDEGLLGHVLCPAERATMGEVPYLVVEAPTGLDDRGVAVVSALSSLYALFALGGAEGEQLLRPLAVRPPTVLDDDLVTIQRYPGKTNEQFTRLLLNVTAASAPRITALRDGGPRPVVLDPLCGRGTTLNTALRYGWSVAGVEIDGKDLDAYALFLRTWLQRKSLKHRYDLSIVRRNKVVLGRRLSVSFAVDKQAWKDGDVQTVTVIGADTMHTTDFFPAAGVDLIVTDAPYGVQHGSRNGGALSRNPMDLLRAAVPCWCSTLRPGGALGIAINTLTAPRDRVAGVLADNGLRVCESDPYRSFAHTVDQAVRRDLVVGVAPE